MDGRKKDLTTKERVHVTHRFGARVAHPSEADKPAPLVNERFVRGRVNHTPDRGEIIAPRTGLRWLFLPSGMCSRQGMIFHPVVSILLSYFPELIKPMQTFASTSVRSKRSITIVIMIRPRDLRLIGIRKNFSQNKHSSENLVFVYLLPFRVRFSRESLGAWKMISKSDSTSDTCEP